ncbi:MAG TPA: autotransporter assembly complex family protein [Telluria sp.]|nr:autotransporter assembly complex family protein [Telluria sp.]
MFFASADQQSAQALRCPRILAQIALAVFTLLPAAALAQQGVSYTVRIDAPAPLDELLRNNLDLVRWRGNPRLDRDQLQRLVKAAPEQVKTLVATEGYYAPRVTASLDTGGAEPVARVVVDPGRPVLVGDVDLVLRGFEPLTPGTQAFDAAALRQHWSLPAGRRFRTADWEQAKRGLLRQVMQTRYPRAQLAESSATVDPDVYRALLRVVLDSGPEARFGGVRVEGLQRYPAAVINNLNQIKPGDEYSEAALQAYQARLQDTGYFSGVDVSADMSGVLDEDIANLTAEQQAARKTAPGDPLVLPVLVRVTENKRRNVALGVGYSTNTGNRAQVNYDDLNVFGLRMKSNIILETRRQTARTDFYFPTTPKGYNDSFGAGFERTDVNGELTSVSTAAVKRGWGSPLLERSVTLEYLSEVRTVAGLPTTSSKSVPLTYSITRRALDNLLVPTSGYVVNAQLGGALLPVLTDERFIRAAARFVTYRPVGASGTLVLRGEAGALASREKAGVPSTYLFRAGGDQSVRGYGYQQLGIQEGTAIVGGRYMATASAEYQYWFKPPWGVAVFYDAGNAADTIKDLKPKSGYGVGARWRSPVGPINVDVAYGHAVKKMRLHFSLGFTF